MRLTTRSLALAIACLGLSALLVSPALAQGDPQVGVWKLNVAKSKYTPGPVPKSGTTKIEAAGAGVKVTVDQTLATAPRDTSSSRRTTTARTAP